jgi:hypothetical protein
LFEIFEIIVFEDEFLSFGVADSCNHGGMIGFIGKEDAIGEFTAESRQGGVVGDVAGGKDECSVFFMEVCEGGFETFGMLIMARNL